ncbi:hypothetical protein WJX74_007196 [Apatococcus lobatus]|uniref:Uncharacterized protein n=1 Tax=Apatococcus lobatus TaxID=904363 RepID=A0AAW1S6R6_9CHLO
MDQVCKYVGGCQFVVGTGDNIYGCGAYPGDTTGRLFSDWTNLYNNPLQDTHHSQPDLVQRVWQPRHGHQWLSRAT